MWFIKTYDPVEQKKRQWRISSDIINKSGAIPKKADGCLISRDREVKEVRSIVSNGGKIIISGNAGVGKTELVKDYVKKYRSKYDGVYYSENVDEIDSYIYCLPIGVIDEDKKTKEEIVIEKLEVIHTMGLSYLFIIDNYTGHVEQLHKLFPNESDKYHLVVVNGELASADIDTPVFTVDHFSPEDSIKIFEFFCNVQYDFNVIMKLLANLSYNPRAIRMSAILLRDNESLTPDELVSNVDKNTSIVDILQNLYAVLTELSIVEKDDTVKLMATYLSLLPYNGVSVERLKSLVAGTGTSILNDDMIDLILKQFEEAGWITVDNMRNISINPLLSDTIFDKLKPDMCSEVITAFLTPILKPIKDIRELFLSQIVALEPFIDQLAKRIIGSPTNDLDILNSVRDYYIATYNTPKMEMITKMMEKEFSNFSVEGNIDIVENAIYRQGISRFNLEDFYGAHTYFSKAIMMLDRKICLLERDIARICAYEGSSLASIGETELAIAYVKRSVTLREKLRDNGFEDQGRLLWVSHYNYSKTLLIIGEYNEALNECNIATDVYKHYLPEEYSKKKSTDVSSLYQLEGRIYAAIGDYQKSIEMLEIAKEIRERIKGEYFFSTAQIYSVLCDVYAANGNYIVALSYAEKYRDALQMQHKTPGILSKLCDIERKIVVYKERMRDNEV